MSDPADLWASAGAIADAVAAGTASARSVAAAALARIAAVNPALNAFTDTTADRALAEADAIDRARAEGQALGPLAGVPYAVKNLFDVEGLTTRAGSKINRDQPPAERDAAVVRRMASAGAVLLGVLNMGEFAYDFTGENAHDGACRNPHDTARMAGGSSSGCGAATAAGLAPISLGSDTNGSIRVPSSFCGIFGLKATYGRLSRAGAFPFADSLDHVGPFARSARDLALAYDAIQGPDADDHACAVRPAAPALPTLDTGIAGLRIAEAVGWFADQSGPDALAAAARAAEALGTAATVDLPGAAAGRAAAYLITNAEGAAFHLETLRTRAADYDPDTRDRFLAGALLPAAWVMKAQRVRRWWLSRLLDAFRHVDVIIAPATPFPAPLIGQKTVQLAGHEVPARPHLGILAQPFSCVGLPVCTVPVFERGALPIGVQLVARPWREDLCLRAARILERAGATSHPPYLENRALAAY